MARSTTFFSTIAVVLVALCGCTSGASPDSTSPQTSTSISASPSRGLASNVSKPYGRLPVAVLSGDAPQRFGAADTRAGVQRAYAFIHVAVNDEAALAGEGDRVIGDYAVVRPFLTSSLWHDFAAEVRHGDPTAQVWGIVPSASAGTLMTDEKGEAVLTRPELLGDNYYGFETRVETSAPGKTRLVVDTKVDLDYRSTTDHQTATLRRDYTLALLKSGKSWLVDAIVTNTSNPA